MKLSEIKRNFEQGIFSEELFVEFQTALKRVPKNMRCQHCYTSAYCLKDKHPKEGIRLIQFGLDNFESDWIDKMRAHQNLGSIYESGKDYESAKSAYITSLSFVPDDYKNDYLPDLAMHILRTELHCANFEYTEYIYDLYQSVITADSFVASFRSFTFYQSIAEIIIAKKDGDCVKQRAAYLTATQALDGDKVTSFDLLLRRHKYKDDAQATKQAITFLKKNKI